MKTLILDGSQADDPMAGRLRAALENNLKIRGWGSETVVLREQKIGNCAGDFYCWIRTPGVCQADDDNRRIAAKIVRSDLLVTLSPVTFGGFSSTFKGMQDHQIQNISPFFRAVNGETHHQKRYKTYPSVLVIGWLDGPDPDTEMVFRHLAYRNSLNMYGRSNVCGIACASQNDDQLTASVNDWLTQIGGATPDRRPHPTLPERRVSSTAAEPLRSAVLLVGSPRTRQSTSASLGEYLFEQLKARGVETEEFQVYTTINSQERMEKMGAAIDRADLVVLSFPLYVDSLPAPVISALEKIAARRQGKPRRPRFAAVANCGFPEAHHNATALAICAEFARSACFEWMGALALGAGDGIVHRTPLRELGGRAFSIKKSLETAADALAAGRPVPESARKLMAKPVIPAWMYRCFGAWGWRKQAKAYGAQKKLRGRPYEGAG